MSCTRFYKIAIGTETYNRIDALIQRIEEAYQVSHQLAVDLGSPDGFILQDSTYVAGGVMAIKMETQPAGWKKVLPKRFPGYFFPKAIKANYEVLRKIRTLPAVARIELSRLVGFHSNLAAPGLRAGDDVYLVMMPDGFADVNLEPTHDMIEITGFEYLQLSKIETIDFDVIF